MASSSSNPISPSIFIQPTLRSSLHPLTTHLQNSSPCHWYHPLTSQDHHSLLQLSESNLSFKPQATHLLTQLQEVSTPFSSPHLLRKDLDNLSFKPQDSIHLLTQLQEVSTPLSSPLLLRKDLDDARIGFGGVLDCEELEGEDVVAGLEIGQRPTPINGDWRLGNGGHESRRSSDDRRRIWEGRQFKINK